MSDQISKTLDKLEVKIDGLDSRLDSIDKTLIKHEENLKEHMKRSYANEEAVNKIVEELKPIKAHVIVVKFVGKVIAWLGGSGLFVYLITKIFH
jgi:hypothetical protein